MTKSTPKQMDEQPGQGPRTAAAEPVAKTKKTYRKPELAIFEQLHGIGLGS